ncbi:MAG UNVERIFIED_CONTAM: hypothetical protein LVT10_19980 [Anaerolineae bacterium]
MSYAPRCRWRKQWLSASPCYWSNRTNQRCVRLFIVWWVFCVGITVARAQFDPAQATPLRFSEAIDGYFDANTPSLFLCWMGDEGSIFAPPS